MYHPGFELSEKIAQQTLSVFGEFLHDSGDKSTDAEFQYLSDRIKELQDIGYENVVGIAVTGDTGSGKSATVNSIIGEDGLTPEVSPPFALFRFNTILTTTHRGTAAVPALTLSRSSRKHPKPNKCQFLYWSSCTAWKNATYWL
jgi:GTPase SAR1 family protein